LWIIGKLNLEAFPFKRLGQPGLIRVASTPIRQKKDSRDGFLLTVHLWTSPSNFEMRGLPYWRCMAALNEADGGDIVNGPSIKTLLA
jgi:hypothetical protein